MSGEVIKINKNMVRENLDMQIAMQCAPLLAGAKISNILITQRTNAARIWELFQDTQIFVKCLNEGKEKITFLLYRKKEIKEYLDTEEVSEYMDQWGYRNLDFEQMLRRLEERYSTYLDEKEEFPHEMGLFLGYPIKDVKGFIENKGKKFLYTGYWKVYDNLEEAIETFETYDRAKEYLGNMVFQGIGIENLIKNCSLNKISLAM
jgi:hypothetical protein